MIADEASPVVVAAKPQSVSRLQRLVAWRGARGLLLALLLYTFLLSIEMLGGTFKLLGRGFAESLVSTTSNHFVGLLIGILATSIVQSSSTVTSLIVGLVGGGALDISAAIPMVMGANIGTSITNTIVALGHLTRPQEFQRAFAGATVHDFFNLLAVALFLPLELLTGLLSRSAEFAERIFIGKGGVEFHSPLRTIVEPVSQGTEDLVTSIIAAKAAAGIVLIVLSLALLMVSLRYIVLLMKSLLMGKVEVLMHRYVFQHPMRGILLGTVLTMLVQSSSVTTSLTVPLLAAGFVSVEQIFPFVLGANVGTTITAVLASLVTGSPAALTVALCHVFFNVYGILVFYPLRRLPIGLAQALGRLTLHSKFYALAYILFTFFLIPLILIFLTR